MMSRDVVQNQFGSNEQKAARRDEQIIATLHPIKLTKVALVIAHENHRLPRFLKQHFQVAIELFSDGARFIGMFVC